MAFGVKAGLALGILALSMGLLLPTMVDATQKDVTAAHNLSEGESETLTDKLEVTVANASGSTYDATIEYVALTDQRTNSTSLNVSNSSTVVLNGYSIETGLLDNSSTSATINSTYSPLFGWNSGAATFVQNMDTLLVVLGAGVLLSLLGLILL